MGSKQVQGQKKFKIKIVSLMFAFGLHLRIITVAQLKSRLSLHPWQPREARKTISSLSQTAAVGFDSGGLDTAASKYRSCTTKWS
jgi:hypothetical protein